MQRKPPTNIKTSTQPSNPTATTAIKGTPPIPQINKGTLRCVPFAVISQADIYVNDGADCGNSCLARETIIALILILY